MDEQQQQRQEQQQQIESESVRLARELKRQKAIEAELRLKKNERK